MGASRGAEVCLMLQRAPRLMPGPGPFHHTHIPRSHPSASNGAGDLLGEGKSIPSRAAEGEQSLPQHLRSHQHREWSPDIPSLGLALLEALAGRGGCCQPHTDTRQGPYRDSTCVVL